MNEDMIFYQLFEKETSTYTYLLADADSKEAILIDPVLEMVERDLQLIGDLKLNLKFILDTHVHADHISASGELRTKTGAKIGLSSVYDLACTDLHLEDGQEIKFGRFTVKVIHTPGHTSGCLSYLIENMVFTGDALLVRGCGRTDFQEGSSDKLFHSVREKIFSLSDNTAVYPAHDYKGFTKTLIGLEKKFNPRLNLEISKEKFVEIMKNLKLPYPKKIKESVPANLQCGLPLTSKDLNTDLIDNVPTVTAENAFTKLGLIKIIDVRGSDEFNNELGHIPNTHLSTLGTQLDEELNHTDKSMEIIFVCRSGKRSAEATRLALNKGFENVYSMQGGMIRWNELQFPTERDLGGS